MEIQGGFCAVVIVTFMLFVELDVCLTQENEDKTSLGNDETEHLKSGKISDVPNADLIQDLKSSGGQKTDWQANTVHRDPTFRRSISANLVGEAGIISQSLKRIVTDELGQKFMQDTFDSLNYLESTTTDSRQAEKLASRIQSKLKTFLFILNSNKRSVESLYKNHRSTPITSSRDCCSMQDNEFLYDTMFGTNVSKDMACDRSSPVTLQGSFNPTKNLTQVFKRNLLRTPTLKWQYFSSQGGIHTIYPGVLFNGGNSRFSCADKFDMRNSELYAQTIRPDPVNVVIFIDHGSGLGENSLKIAKQAAEVALNSLSVKDKVGVLSVASDVVHCGEDKCYTNSLAPASNLTKQQLKRFISTIQPDRGPTNHSLGLLKAFDLIQRSTKTQKKNETDVDSVILYVSAGRVSQEDEYQTAINLAINENRRLQNRVVIMTYPLVEADGKTSLAELGFLRDLGEQDNGTQQHPSRQDGIPERQKGVMTVLNQMSNLPSTIGQFYTILRAPTQPQVSFSLPYLDPFGTGLIVSLSKPCFTNDEKPFGIVGVDISLADLLEDITYFGEGGKSYAMLVDNLGHTISHPALPKPLSMQHPLFFADVSHFEQAVSFGDVRDSMLRGDMGFRDLRQSVNSTNLARYSWSPVESSPFIVCTVLISDDLQVRYLKHLNIQQMEILYYHRLDLLPAPTMCHHMKQLSSTVVSTLMLSANSFDSPFEQLTHEETKLVVQAYMAYLNDDTELIRNPGLKPSIKNHVAATCVLGDYWKRQVASSNLNSYIVRRYIATTSGVIWMYPGTLLSKKYDPTRRSWYKQAQANPGLVSVTSPYLDQGGAGYIVTLSTVIFEGRLSGDHDKTDHVIAVMGIDLTLQYFYKLLVDTLPVCKDSGVRCFVMDDKGYLVAHPHMLEPLKKAPIEDQHITHKEVLISNDLLYQHEFVHKLQCNSYLNGTVQRFYSFNTSYRGVLTNEFHSEHCIQYKMTPIPGTNAFVGVVNETCNIVTAFCPCSMVDRTCLNCNRMEQTECECPCECHLAMDPCSGTLKNEEDRNPACQVEEEEAEPPYIDPKQYGNLGQCFNSKCNQRISWSDCFGVIDCEWCTVGVDGKSLSSPYCATQRECFGGVVGAANPYHDQIVRSTIKPYQPGAVSQLGPVAGALMGVVTFLILIIYVYCHHAHSQSEIGNHGSDVSVRVNVSSENVNVVDGMGDDDQNGPGRGAPYAQGNIVLAAIDPPNPYHQNPRRGIRVWRRHGNAPSESDHGYSTMTPHEDSEYHYVEPEPIVVSPERNTVDPPPGTINVRRPRPPSPSAYSSLLDCESDAATCGSGPTVSIPKLDPPPKTVASRKSHRMRTRADVHNVDTVC